MQYTQAVEHTMPLTKPHSQYNQNKELQIFNNTANKQ
jgi:hypothetical protein